ncbi:hypothetical protein E6H21_09515 [Candidatus Bathyarchaeota archaeon]|nr:MAG: hypothetical protein E6H21_09515 [Candidatus Bathyarchaeota archaeon]
MREIWSSQSLKGSLCMPESGKNQAPHGSLLPFTVTRSVTSREMSSALDASDAKFGSWELAKSNPFSVPLIRVRNPQTVPLGVRQAQN